ncbi:uncharacterized protein [Rutidosis leptorrhynchoides]|uniref:uncharacterized protein n=1 Tax=Rutidosis leptorrhynchoides TaxID=125765 RepID=UPI003A994472
MALVPARDGSSLTYQVPILTATNYLVWAVKVKAIMDAYGILETVEPRMLSAEIDPEKSKRALAFLFQAIPEEMVLQMASYTDPKQVWDGLKTRYLGVDRVRSARLATLKREFEGLRMKEEESVDEFATKLTGLASKARSLGYELEEVDLVKMLLDSMPIGESSNRDDYGRDREKGRGSGKSREGGERMRDKSRVKCYGCGELGHYHHECPTREKKAHLVEEEHALTN